MNARPMPRAQPPDAQAPLWDLTDLYVSRDDAKVAAARA